MIIDSHEHLMLPVESQIDKMNQAGIDKTILFCTTPHPENAKNLQELAAEMNTLQKILAGTNTKAGNMQRLKDNINKVTEAIRAYPNRFLGFGTVPLGLTLHETEEWLISEIIQKSLCGIGEFSPSDKQQIAQMKIIFQAVQNTKIMPIWIHTFHPVTLEGIKEIVKLCAVYPVIPVIFGHMGGIHWMEVIKMAKTHKNIYLDLSAAFTSLSTKIAIAELPERCLYSSDAPYGEPCLYRELIEFFCPTKEIASMVLGENILKLLKLL